MTDWERVREEKEAHRIKSAALPFEEKLRILERLRERDQSFRESRMRLDGDDDKRTPVMRVQQVPSGQTIGKIHVKLFGANPVLLVASDPQSASGKPR